MEAGQAASSSFRASPIHLHPALFSTYIVHLQTRHGSSSLTFDALARLFVLPSTLAAQEIGVSSRTLIRVCRSLGIRRWPFLSIRGDDSVKRIRHEAIGNLARQLSKRGGCIPPAGSVLYPQTHVRDCHSMEQVRLLMESPLDLSGVSSSEAEDVVEHVHSAFGTSTDASLFDRLGLQRANTLESTTRKPRTMSMRDILGAAVATT